MNTSFFEAFKAPIDEPRGFGKLLFGGFLIILSGVFISNLGNLLKFFIGNDYNYIFTILSVIGYLLQCVILGYCIKSAHNCIQNEILLMPEWTHIAEYIGYGIISAIILFLYSLPLMLIFFGITYVIPQDANTPLIFIVIFLFTCILIMLNSTVLMFYFKDLKIKDALRIGDILKVFFKNLPKLFLIFLSLLGLSIFTFIVAILISITIIGILLLPALSLLNIIASFYIIAKEGRDILWEENMWGADED